MMRACLAFLAVVLLATGCSHYHMGMGAEPSFATLYVAPAKNKTRLAQTQTVLSTMLREAFERDGRVSLATAAGDADATLEVTLVDYRRQNAANRKDDVGLARKFTLHLSARCTLRDNRTGKVLFADRVVEVQREAFTDNGLGSVPFAQSNDQLQSEYNTFPLLAQELSSRITHAVLDVW